MGGVRKYLLSMIVFLFLIRCILLSDEMQDHLKLAGSRPETDGGRGVGGDGAEPERAESRLGRADLS